MFNINWLPSPWQMAHKGARSKPKPKRRTPKQKPGEYRHIEVLDFVDHPNKTRTLTVTCPLEYPGLTEVERRKMYEGLAMVADAFRAADARCARNHK